MINYRDHFENERDEEEEEQIRELKELLDELASEMRNPKSSQKSLQRDYNATKFVEITASSQQFIDWQYLSIYSN